MRGVGIRIAPQPAVRDPRAHAIVQMLQILQMLDANGDSNETRVLPLDIRLAFAVCTVQPLFDLRMRLGEGSGAAVATMIVRAALATHNGMATFAEAGVSKES